MVHMRIASHRTLSTDAASVRRVVGWTFFSASIACTSCISFLHDLLVQDSWSLTSTSDYPDYGTKRQSILVIISTADSAESSTVPPALRKCLRSFSTRILSQMWNLLSMTTISRFSSITPPRCLTQFSSEPATNSWSRKWFSETCFEQNTNVFSFLRIASSSWINEENKQEM